jgi:hypothetical protein
MLALAIIGCAHPLPEANSQAARLYSNLCGSCHQAYDQRSLTADMWRIQMRAMEAKIAAAGEPPLSAEDEHALLDYLRRNAGAQ